MEGAMSGQTENGQWAAGATETSLKDARGLIIQYAWWLKKQGLKDETIVNYTSKLKILASNGAELNQPETVKDVLAKLQKALYAPIQRFLKCLE